MRIAYLSDHRHLTSEIAKSLHEEWSTFAPWASLPTVEARLLEGSQSYAFPFVLVALSCDNSFLGTASIKLFELPNHPEKKHWLSEVFIPKNLRGSGIGSALIAACIERCRDRGVEALYLYTPDQQNLYQRFGWRETMRTTVNNELVSIMAREIIVTSVDKKDD